MANNLTPQEQEDLRTEFAGLDARVVELEKERLAIHTRRIEIIELLGYEITEDGMYPYGIRPSSCHRESSDGLTEE